MDKALVDLAQGQEARITLIEGGRGMQERLRRLGLSEGRLVRKVSALAMGGPIVVRVNRTQIAVGRGMARRIYVDVPADRRHGSDP